MKENLHSLTTWWQKIKALFARKSNENSLVSTSAHYRSEADPMLLIDQLQALVQKFRSELEVGANKQWDLDILAASTYLYHVDRILIKVRENMLTYRFRMDEFKENNDILKQNEFLFAKEAHAHAYIAILNLTTVLKKTTLKQIYTDHIVNPIHALEIESANLNSAIRALNQLCYRQEALLQLNALEQNLMQTLSSAPPDYVYTHQGIMYSATEYLRNQLKEVSREEDIAWLSAFIETQDMLKKCYVVARKGVIKELLDKMSDNIQLLVTAFNRKNPDEEKIFEHLTAIFNAMESIRFNCHRENGCSKNLFDKVKMGRQQLRKACQNHPLGREYLIRVAIKREPLKVKQFKR